MVTGLIKCLYISQPLIILCLDGYISYPFFRSIIFPIGVIKANALTTLFFFMVTSSFHVDKLRWQDSMYLLVWSVANRHLTWHEATPHIKLISLKKSNISIFKFICQDFFDITIIIKYLSAVVFCTCV